jgi:hypothetical protein
VISAANSNLFFLRINGRKELFSFLVWTLESDSNTFFSHAEKEQMIHGQLATSVSTALLLLHQATARTTPTQLKHMASPKETCPDAENVHGGPTHKSKARSGCEAQLAVLMYASRKSNRKG